MLNFNVIYQFHNVNYEVISADECHKDKVCVTKRQCHSSDIISNPACREDCQQCFDYKYMEGTEPAKRA